MDAYFESFPGIREYLDRQVDRATVDGYTETLLGRRRYIPELHASNPRVRDLGRRQALNAPIQGSASDVFKVAMIHVDRGAPRASRARLHMLLTVHDELVFEVAEAHVDEAAALDQGAHGERGRTRRRAPGRHRLGSELGGGRPGRTLTPFPLVTYHP